MERKGKQTNRYVQRDRRLIPTFAVHKPPRLKQFAVPRSIAQFSLLVREYDEAIDFYVRVLGFELLEDTPISEEKRWVRVAPPEGGGAALLLARASTDAQRGLVGKQAAERVWLFLETDDFAGDYRRLKEYGVSIIRERSEEIYGTVCVFADLYGNRWDLIQRKA